MAGAKRPVVEIVSGTAAKRKRDVVEERSTAAHRDEEIRDAKRKRSSSPFMNQAQIPAAEAKAENGVSVKAEPVVDPSRVCEAIQSQFSLEILLKHNELRLINQELAKCQVALEQLRRCHLIPYPLSQGTPESMLNMVNGTGPALSQGTTVPQWAPPYGVTDGPYARHYAKWLIPDARFDGVQVDWQRGFDSRAGKTLPEGRATRYSHAEGVPASKARSQRGAGSQKLQALSSGYSQPKDKAGPCVLKRADGQTVKLVCLDCHRENFSSTQGFINHCRIAHHRDFKSHEEAAVASGQPIEIDEVGGIVGEEKTPAIATGLVHPMVRNAPITKEAYSAVMSRIKASMELYKKGDPRVPSIPTIQAPVPSTAPVAKAHARLSSNFVASSSSPFLSTLLSSRGFVGDFDKLVGDVKAKVDYDDESESDDVDSQPTPTQHQPSNGLGLDGTDASMPPLRVPARAGVSPAPLARPVSSKGLSVISPRLSHGTPAINTAAANHNRPTSRRVSTPTTTDDRLEQDLDVEMIDGPSMVDLSPNTVASNKPPSLVSDDDDYDDGSDPERQFSSSEDEDSDVAEIDIEDDGVDKVVPRTVMRNRAGSGTEAMRLRKEDKHVTFVSPVKDKERRSRRT